MTVGSETNDPVQGSVPYVQIDAQDKLTGGIAVSRTMHYGEESSGRCCAGRWREQVAGQRVPDGRTAVLPSSAQHVGSDLLALVNAAHTTQEVEGRRGRVPSGEAFTETER